MKYNFFLISISILNINTKLLIETSTQIKRMPKNTKDITGYMLTFQHLLMKEWKNHGCKFELFKKPENLEFRYFLFTFIHVKSENPGFRKNPENFHP